MLDKRRSVASFYEFIKQLLNKNEKGVLRLYLQTGEILEFEFRLSSQQEPDNVVYFTKKKSESA